MYYQKREIRIKVKSFIAVILLIFLFDGIVRFIADYLGVYFINAWKDLTILFTLGLTLSLIGFALQKFYISVWDMLFLTMFAYSIPIGIIDHGVLQTIWGIKIFFLPVIFYIFAFNLMKQRLDDETIYRFLFLMLILATPIIIFGYIQYVTHFLIFKTVAPVVLGKLSFIKLSYISTTPRAIGTFRSPFAFGDFSAYVVIFSFAFMSKTRNFSSKTIFLILMILGFVGIYISTSRTSMLVALYGILALLILKYFRNSSTQLKLLLFVITIALPIFVMFIAIFGLGRHGGKLFFLFSTESTFARLVTWYDAIVQYPFFKNPLTFLFGYGAGAIGTAQRQVGSKFYNPVDNIFLYMLINFGFVGLAIFLNALLWPVSQFIENIKDYDFGWQDVVVVLTLGVLFVEGMYRTFFEGFPLPYIFWFLHFYFRLGLKT